MFVLKGPTGLLCVALFLPVVLMAAADEGSISLRDFPRQFSETISTIKVPESLSLQLAELNKYKTRAIGAWNELPTWGKYLASGTVVLGTFGSFCLINRLRRYSLVSDPALITRDAVKARLVQSVNASRELLAQCSDEGTKVGLLIDVFQQIITEPYSADEQGILRNLMQLRLLKSRDLFDLWRFACEKEHDEHGNSLRNWIATQLVDTLWIESTDKNAVIAAVRSGVDGHASVIFTDRPSEGPSSSTSSLSFNESLITLESVFLGYAFPLAISSKEAFELFILERPRFDPLQPIWLNGALTTPLAYYLSVYPLNLSSEEHNIQFKFCVQQSALKLTQDEFRQKLDKALTGDAKQYAIPFIEKFFEIAW